ncbi:uncharacterized protein MYCFIDRAFT_84477 [Pseudocercospora fijiensis CIRAD86]|uniref:Uncharacterized protein n=1 Tax=Pseudocercospora fijiensis (strain CIRAD86) TaxID=383855 RepID=M2Z961_PSEFD|nr:uncharacterized protein MYCFIDRAFT_84477 [Pseudocercospora fijiensis CIRAD86]EME86330.1 hypothetical protein MYCFIDRAFT_84477 [Pseudocercospora fijiensis CIRAD86]
MTSLVSFLNRLLPFATPGTPLVQDLLHLGVICSLLYFAPQIQEYVQRRHLNPSIPEQPPVGQDDDGPEVPSADEQVADQHDPDPTHQDNGVGEPVNVNEDDFNGAVNGDLDGPANRVPVAGPANGRPQRNVGAKKAKALARRDQRRAYHEFQRSQGEAQRAKDAEGASEREKAQSIERERRKAVEAKLDEKKAKEREQRREQERKEREQEMQRREQAIDLVREQLQERQMSNVFEVARQVGGDADDVWLEKILKAAGVLGKNADDSITIATSLGWIVRVQRQDMLKAYEKAAAAKHSDDGEISYEDLGTHLEAVLREKVD